MHCISPQNLECVALSVQNLWKRSHILNLGHVTLAAPIFNVRTKYEVSIFNHHEDTKGSQYFEIGHVT